MRFIEVIYWSAVAGQRSRAEESRARLAEGEMSVKRKDQNRRREQREEKRELGPGLSTVPTHSQRAKQGS